MVHQRDVSEASRVSRRKPLLYVKEEMPEERVRKERPKHPVIRVGPAAAASTRSGEAKSA